jgi:hypothetical protein
LLAYDSGRLTDQEKDGEQTRLTIVPFEINDACKRRAIIIQKWFALLFGLSLAFPLTSIMCVPIDFVGYVRLVVPNAYGAC